MRELAFQCAASIHTITTSAAIKPVNGLSCAVCVVHCEWLVVMNVTPSFVLAVNNFCQVETTWYIRIK